MVRKREKGEKESLYTEIRKNKFVVVVVLLFYIFFTCFFSFFICLFYNLESNLFITNKSMNDL